MKSSDQNSKYRCLVYIVVVSVFSIAQGLTYPLFSFRLHFLGFSEGFIGTSGMMTPLGVVLSSFALPWLSARLTIKSLILYGTGLTILCISTLCFVSSPLFWLVTRFFLGISINLIYITTETGIMDQAPKKISSFLLGLYVAVSNIGYAIGPAIISVAGAEENSAFYIGVIIVIASSAPVLLIKAVPIKNATEPKHVTRSKFSFLAPLFLFAKAHPYITFTSVAASFFDTCLMNMFPLFGLGEDLSSKEISTALFLFVIGGVCFQIPIAKILNTFSRRATTLVLSIALISLCIVLPLFSKTIILFPLMFLVGGAVFAIQTASLTTLSKEVPSAARPTGNSSNAFFWGLCNIFGIPLSGYLMQLFGSKFLMYLLALPVLGVLYFSWLGRKELEKD